MDAKVKNGMLVGAGFLLGTLGVKAVTSKRARSYAVQGLAAGLRAKAGYECVVEDAKAQLDDIVAEAEFLNAESQGKGEACSCGCSEQEKDEQAPAEKSE